MDTRISLALALLLSCPAAAAPQTQGLVRLGVVHSHQSADGTLVFRSPRGVSRGAVPEALEGTGAIGSPRRVLLVDRRGMGWSADGRDVTGWRDGVCVQRYALGANLRRGAVAEDMHGRVWFAGEDRVAWFDGTEWAERALDLPTGRLHSPKVELSASGDRSRIYVWRNGAGAFLDVSGVEPQFTLVDRSRGIRDGVISGVFPVGSSTVMVLPSYTLLHADQWTAPPQGAPSPLVEANRSRVLGAYELVNHPTVVSAAAGSVYVSAPRALKWPAGTTPKGGHGSEFWRDPSPATHLVPYGKQVMFRVFGDGQVERLSPAAECFGATEVDSRGRHWRLDPERRLFVLEGERVYRLSHRASGQAAKVQFMHGADRGGRIVMQLVDGVSWASIPAPQGGRDRALLGSEYHWKKITHRVWRPSDESEAWTAATEAVRSGELQGAQAIAETYGGQAQAGVLLEHAADWPRVSSLLTRYAYGRANTKELEMADLAMVFGLSERARGIAIEFLERPTGAPTKDRLRDWGRLAAFAGRNGMDDVCLKAYIKIVALQLASSADPCHSAMAAGRCAVRLRRFRLAQRFFGIAEDHMAGWQRQDAAKLQGIVGDLLEARDDPEAQIQFVRNYFQMLRHDKEGEAPAWEWVLANMELSTDQERTVRVALLHGAVRSKDYGAARLRADALVALEPENHEQASGALLSAVNALDPRRDADRMLAALLEVAALYPSTYSAALSWTRASHILNERGQHRRVIEGLSKWVTLDGDGEGVDRFAFDVLAHQVALSLATAHESLGELDTALRYAKASLGKYGPRSGCGTCNDSMVSMAQSRVAALEKKVAASK